MCHDYFLSFFKLLFNEDYLDKETIIFYIVGFECLKILTVNEKRNHNTSPKIQEIEKNKC